MLREALSRCRRDAKEKSDMRRWATTTAEEFMEEAKKCTRAEQRNLQLQRDREKAEDYHEDMKNKKSWKNSLLFWRRSSQRKDKILKGTNQSNTLSAARGNDRSVSGPIFKIATTIAPTCRGRRMRSGVIDRNIPYASLHSLNRQNIDGVRPIYLVT